jgi:pyruvate dehydrogenase E2 component (dihydrolipoamide acetyltransferase)
LRARLAAQGVEVTINDVVLKAVVLSLREHPRLNSWFVDESIRIHRNINLAIAVEVDGGLITPVIPACQDLTLTALAKTARDLVSRARSGRLRAHELTDSTITVSNLGMLGVAQFQAIINPPEVAIVAVGAVRTAPIFIGNAWAPLKVISVTVSADHRAVDGADVARFLATMSQLLETGIESEADSGSSAKDSASNKASK